MLNWKVTSNDNGVFYEKRKCSEVIDFFTPGTFQSLYAAQEWLTENGYSYGSLCNPEPVAILKGDFLIAKWKNLTADERADIDGVLISDDFREGACKILIFDKE